MNIYTKTAVITVLSVLIGTGVIAAVNAQTVMTMPTIYNQYGSPVNTGSGYLPAGYYYLGGGASTGGHQIEYYGNGTYYDPSIQQYGGSVADQNGTAGFTLSYAGQSVGRYGVAVMPTIYNQSGSPVNTGSGYLPAGYYYLGGGASTGGHQIEYYGNGTYYDPTIRQYGGSVHDQNGTAGVSLGYSA